MRVPTPATTDRTVNVSLKRSPRVVRAAAQTAAKEKTAAKKKTSAQQKVASKKNTAKKADTAMKATPVKTLRPGEIDDSSPYGREKTIDPFH